MEQDSLEAVREEIDSIDTQMLELISRRARCAERVAEIKQAQGLHTEFYRPEREAQILRRVRDTNPGPLSSETMVLLFREIISACLAHEEPMTVAYLGPEGSYTQAAAQKHFGHAVISEPLASTADIFKAVSSGSAKYGVVPVENSSEGIESHTLDFFMSSTLKICGEVRLPIHHKLLGQGQALDKITQVYAPQQSLLQCRAWLEKYLPDAALEAVASNAEAAQRAQAQPGCAAIASVAAGELYQLKVLATDIEDDKDSATRFLVIGKQAVKPSGCDTTTLLVSASNRPGGLRELLKPLSDGGISMHRIESRPCTQGLSEVVFFIDLEGHQDDEPIAKALMFLQEELPLFKVLGSYPRAI